MVCSRCGYVLDPFDRTCPRCAQQMRMGPVSAPAVSTPVQTVTLPNGQTCKVCPSCRQPAVLNMIACGRCGYHYGAAGQSPGMAPPASMRSPYGSSVERSRYDPNHPDRRRERQTAILIGALLCLLLIGFVIVPLTLRSRHAVGSSGLLIVPSDGGNDKLAGGDLVGAAVDPKQIDQRLVEAGATTGGELEISLAWNSLTDLDIQVRDPSGELISANHRRSASGGVQDVDANPTLVTAEGSARSAAGQNPGPENVTPLPEFMVDLDKQVGLPGGTPGLSSLFGLDGKAPSRFTRTPVEHIYFAHAPKGTYTVYAHCYSWREPNSVPLPFTIEVRSCGKVVSQTTGTLGPANYINDNTTPSQVCQFTVR